MHGMGVNTMAKKLTTGGPGWHRMQDRLGLQYMEQMRQRLLQEQHAALAAALAECAPPMTQQDRESYRDYPASRPGKHRRK